MDNTNTVSKSAKGKNYLVVGLRHQETHMLNTLLAMGIAPGRSIKLVQESPLGDPIIIEVDNTRWAVRKSLWEQLELVEQVAGTKCGNA